MRSTRNNSNDNNMRPTMKFRIFSGCMYRLPGLARNGPFSQAAEFYSKKFKTPFRGCVVLFFLKMVR